MKIVTNSHVALNEKGNIFVAERWKIALVQSEAGN